MFGSVFRSLMRGPRSTNWKNCASSRLEPDLASSRLRGGDLSPAAVFDAELAFGLAEGCRGRPLASGSPSRLHAEVRIARRQFQFHRRLRDDATAAPKMASPIPRSGPPGQRNSNHRDHARLRAGRPHHIADRVAAGGALPGPDSRMGSLLGGVGTLRPRSRACRH